MAFDCPHCSKAIDNIVPLDRLKEQKATFQKAEESYKAKLAEQEAKLAEATAGLAELPALRQRFEQATQVEVLRSAGLSPELLPHLLPLHRAARELAEEGTEPPDFAAWVTGPAKEHPLLGHLFAAPPAGAPAGTPAPAAPPTRKLPPDTGAPPPPPGPKKTPDEIRAEIARMPTGTKEANAARTAKLLELTGRAG